jgi:hypothetical protein
MTPKLAQTILKSLLEVVEDTDMRLTLASLAFGLVSKDVSQTLGISSEEFGKTMLKPSADLISALDNYKKAIKQLMAAEPEEWAEVIE